MTEKFWLLKAEPDTRIVKGKDVKFSVNDFEKIKTSPWEGVRNYEARNLMKEMKVGEQALFYHSNCKNPGIAGFAEVAKEAYPDHTAWDINHPYYDAKTDSSNPRWFMVDLTFKSRAKNFVPLALLRFIADTDGLPEEISYIGAEGATAIKGMDLVTRGRLSVQRVDGKAWDVLERLAETGGWEEMDLKPKKAASLKKKRNQSAERNATDKPKAKTIRKRHKKDEEDGKIPEDEKQQNGEEEETEPTRRRSQRLKRI